MFGDSETIQIFESTPKFKWFDIKLGLVVIKVYRPLVCPVMNHQLGAFKSRICVNFAKINVIFHNLKY